MINKMKLFLLSAIFLTLSSCANTVNKTTITREINIHINQVALEQHGEKSAVISSNKILSPENRFFSIIDSKNQQKVFNGQLTALADFNQWQQNQQVLHYYRADFSAFTQNGHFKLQLSTATTSSSTFIIAQQAQFKTTIKALLSYFKASRNDQKFNWQQDKHIRIFGSERFVDVHGGYNDAGGDTGKYLSHLSYANYFNPQQMALVTWALAKSYSMIPNTYQALNLTKAINEEIFWGADYLHRILDPKGYFYMTVFDQWNTNNAERVVTAYVGADGIYSKDYQAAFREGAGAAIAALARAALLAKNNKVQGEYTSMQYLADAEKAFAHLQQYNKNYCDNGEENIIDDYTALLAATELYKSTNKPKYLQAARTRANNLQQRLTKEGWFISNNINSTNKRPFYHGSDAGLPLVALSEYLTIEKDSQYRQAAQHTIKQNLIYQVAITTKVSNPFNYARQSFKTYKNGQLSQQYQEGFFIPHANETNYWWQGESARLSSLSTAASFGIKAANISGETAKKLQIFAQNQLDWTLGRNPYDLTMLHGFGHKNPLPYDDLTMVKGGISNGITGSKTSDNGKGIEFAPEKDWHNWRWVEQWLPHSTWFLLAISAQAQQ